MGALTLIQSGFFSAAASGRWAFSGWRGLLVASSTTVINELHDTDVLSDDEYTAARTRLLERLRT